MTIYLLFVLPKNIGNNNPNFRSYRILLFEMVYFIKPPDKLNFHYKDGSKILKYLISQNEKENQKTDIVNM